MLVMSYHTLFLTITGNIIGSCSNYVDGVYCYELNSMKPIVYWYDAGIQDNKEGG